MFLTVLFSTGCDMAAMQRTFSNQSILGILLTKDQWIPSYTIQRNSQLTSLKRNEITTVCSFRSHFLTYGFKTALAYTKSNCITAASTMIMRIMIFFGLSAFCAMHWTQRNLQKIDAINTMILLKTENQLKKKIISCSSFLS